MAFEWVWADAITGNVNWDQLLFGADSQTFKHIVNNCPLQSLHQGIAALHSESKAELKWLSALDLAL